MKRILVPVDFSKVAEAACQYSVHLANAIGADIELIHVIDASLPATDAYFLESLDVAYNAAVQKLSQFSIELKVQIPNHISLKETVRFGSPGFVVADFANDNNIDYIVAGMRDKHSLIERILGTTSTIITKVANCPVILIHENTHWVEPKKVIFTLDDSIDFDESVEKFLTFNAIFNAKTDFIHIKMENEDYKMTQNVVLSEIFSKHEPTFGFEIKTIYGGDIVQTIVDYSIFEKADLLVMVHRKRSFLDTFFNKSLTIKTAEGFHLPIMVLEERLNA
jgi:nucleotide-binding universal stress UspA family protein